MAILKHDSDDLKAKLTLSAEMRTYTNLVDDFYKSMRARFKQIKDSVESWQDAITNEALLVQRLKNIADNADYTENNLLDMALISVILWNIEGE